MWAGVAGGKKPFLSMNKVKVLTFYNEELHRAFWYSTFSFLQALKQLNRHYSVLR